MWIPSAVSPILVETPEPARAVDSFSIDGQTTGTKSANLFPGFTSPTMSIVTGNNAYGASAHKYAKAADNATATLVSNYACMDCEVTVRAGVVKVALRYDASTGTGYALNIPANGIIAIGPVGSGILLSDYNTLGGFQFTVNLADFGWTGMNETDTFTLGLVGYIGYVKWNGITVKSWLNTYQPIPGKCIIWGHPSYDGVSDASITYLPATMIGSNRARKVIDIRDYGASQFQTTGSMTSGSNQLVVADASGFAVGNRVIVETSGEPGAGLPGTMGVGGAYPNISYATVTAMNADTSQVPGTEAWVINTGLVYIWSGSAWSANASGTDPATLLVQNLGGYYVWKSAPKALVATITAKSGTTLTLDATSSAATTNTRVYFDNYGAFAAITEDGISGVPFQSGVIVKVPEGNWPLGQRIGTGSHTKTAWTLCGVSKDLSKLFAPRGAPNIGVGVQVGTDWMVHSISIEGNHKPDPTNSNYPIYYRVPEYGAGLFYGGWDRTISIAAGCDRAIVKDIHFIDVMSAAMYFGGANYGQAYRVTLTMNARIMAYTQWYIGTNSNNNTFYDCQILYSVGLIKAFETFASNDNRFYRCGGMNALCSTNNSSRWLYEDFASDIYSDSFSYVNAGWWNEAVININNNSFHSATGGGSMVRPRVIQHGYVNSNNDTLPAVQVAPDVTNVVITGEYDSDATPFVDTKGGYFQAPDYAVIDPTRISGGVGASTGRGLIIEAPGTVVTGTRIVGASKSTNYNFRVESTATGSTITGNIADRFNYGATITKSGNRTNAGVSVP